MSPLDVLPLAHLPYGEQLALRSARVARAFERLNVGPVAPIVPSPRQAGSRARVSVRVEGGQVGFHRPGTHEFLVTPLEDLARPELVVEAVSYWPRNT